MLPFVLTWTPINPVLCPGCLKVLANDDIIFRDNLAFCPLCALPRSDLVRDTCLRVFNSALAPDQWASYRGLSFFTPSRRPGVPLHLVRRGSPDDWLLDPDTDYDCPDLWTGSPDPDSVIDDNPAAGGSPI